MKTKGRETNINTGATLAHLAPHVELLLSHMIEPPLSRRRGRERAQGDTASIKYAKEWREREYCLTLFNFLVLHLSIKSALVAVPATCCLPPCCRAVCTHCALQRSSQTREGQYEVCTKCQLLSALGEGVAVVYGGFVLTSSFTSDGNVWRAVPPRLVVDGRDRSVDNCLANDVNTKE